MLFRELIADYYDYYANQIHSVDIIWGLFNVKANFSLFMITFLSHSVAV
jgi:hypothetical protein